MYSSWISQYISLLGHSGHNYEELLLHISNLKIDVSKIKYKRNFKTHIGGLEMVLDYDETYDT